MERYEAMEVKDRDRPPYEFSGLLSEPVPAGRWAFSRQRQAWRPPTDVYETAECLIVKVEIAGMQRTDLHIALKAKELTISGMRQDPSAKLGYQQMEIQYGSFESLVSLPAAVQEDAVEASYQDGFLTIRLPKAKPHRVQVTYT